LITSWRISLNTMSLGDLIGSAGQGVAFVIGAEAVAAFVAKACSSPQTTHLNAGKRADTLMLWVNAGMLESAVIVGIAAMIDRKHGTALIAGAVFEGIITYGEYLYAKQAGVAEQAQGAPATEEW
jgi:hypothetical protein